MVRYALSMAAAVLLGSFALADDKKEAKKEEAPAPTGTWVREAEGLEVKFTFKKEALTIYVGGGGNSITCKAKYSIDKDGVLKATINDVEEKGDFPNKPAKGMEFTMKFTIDKDKKSAKASDFKAEGAEAAKPIIEGDYAPKKD